MKKKSSELRGGERRVLFLQQHLLAASSDKEMCSTICVLASIQITLGIPGIYPRIESGEKMPGKNMLLGFQEGELFSLGVGKDKSKKCTTVASERLLTPHGVETSIGQLPHLLGPDFLYLPCVQSELLSLQKSNKSWHA